jgi:drug/metabolite transporter (DMT)-like permease
LFVKAVLLGILASFFFAVTFILNRLMSDGGGSWIWSASLRYLFMLPILLILVFASRKLSVLFAEMRAQPWQWLCWSLVGFGLFYAPLCFAAAYSPGWLVAGTWQFTIIAGSLIVPLFYETVPTCEGVRRVRKRIPLKGIGMSVIILLGIGFMEWSQATYLSGRDMFFGTSPILVAAFAYPLGNRKMMELCEGRLNATERTLGMTIASLPLWLVLSIYQCTLHGLPSVSQSVQSLMVAVFSGVVATVLFFTATDLAKGNVHRLASVEATQSGEVIFALIGELIVIPGTDVSWMGLVGLLIVVTGMVLHSFASSRGHQSSADETIHVSV